MQQSKLNNIFIIFVTLVFKHFEKNILHRVKHSTIYSNLQLFNMYRRRLVSITSQSTQKEGSS